MHGPTVCTESRYPTQRFPTLMSNAKVVQRRITDGASRNEDYKIINTYLCPEGSTKTITLDSADLCSSSISEELKVTKGTAVYAPRATSGLISFPCCSSCSNSGEGSSASSSPRDEQSIVLHDGMRAIQVL